MPESTFSAKTDRLQTAPLVPSIPPEASAFEVLKRRFTDAAGEAWVTFPFATGQHSEASVRTTVTKRPLFSHFTVMMKGLDAILVHLLPPGPGN